jgi:predicted ATPase
VEPVVRTLTLKRFRSVPSERVTFANPTFLVGRNGSGKSNIVDAFAFLSEAMVSPLLAVFDRRGGIAVVRNRSSGRSYPPNLGLGVTLGNINGQSASGRYAFEVRALANYGYEVIREQCDLTGNDGQRFWFDRTRKGFSSNVKGLEPSTDPAALALPIIGGDARFAPVVRTLALMRVYAIEPSELREMQDPDAGTSLKKDGSNAASVLQEIERHSNGDIRRICELLATIVPNTTSVHSKKHGNKLSLTFTQEWGDKRRLHFDAFSMSDGTLRAVGLLSAVFQKPTPALLAIEEPEATIHPGALGAVLDLLRHASKGTQLVITTHSPDVLDAKWIKDSNVRIVEWQEGATRVGELSAASRQAIQEHLMGAGELLRANALDPEPLFEEGIAQQQLDLFEDFG